MKGFCPLASGSKGNCIYFGSDEAKILIDAGISAKRTKESLEILGVALEDIDAILITHEHTDHIKGLDILSGKMGIPIFANSDTAKAIQENLTYPAKYKIFATGETFQFKDLEIHPFSIQHDTVDPVAFIIKTGNIKVGVCADIGFATTLVKNKLKGCDYLYIEANHQIEMVHASSRPLIYKQRVLGRQGHLSNEDCAKLLKEIMHKDLKSVYLAHLSSECNAPEVALRVIKESNQHLDLKIAYQEKISDPVKF